MKHGSDNVVTDAKLFRQKTIIVNYKSMGTVIFITYLT